MGRVEQIGDCTLYLGDCLEIMPTLGKVDAVVTDPPYGIGFKYDGYNDTEESFIEFMGLLRDYPSAILQYPEEIMRLCVPVLGAPDEVMAWVYGSNLPRQLRLWGFWGCDVDPKRSKQPARNPECAKVLNDNVAGYDWREFPQVKNTSPDKTAHPCQLPIGVALWVLEALNAETIIDPFMGSGTTGVACAKLGRKFIGIEINEGYFNISCERIQKAYDQPDFFTPQPKKITQERMMFDDET